MSASFAELPESLLSSQADSQRKIEGCLRKRLRSVIEPCYIGWPEDISAYACHATCALFVCVYRDRRSATSAALD
jgi:hypothetical protein